MPDHELRLTQKLEPTNSSLNASTAERLALEAHTAFPRVEVGTLVTQHNQHFPIVSIGSSKGAEWQFEYTIPPATHTSPFKTFSDSYIQLAKVTEPSGKTWTYNPASKEWLSPDHTVLGGKFEVTPDCGWEVEKWQPGTLRQVSPEGTITRVVSPQGYSAELTKDGGISKLTRADGSTVEAEYDPNAGKNEEKTVHIAYSNADGTNNMDWRREPGSNTWHDSNGNVWDGRINLNFVTGNDWGYGSLIFAQNDNTCVKVISPLGYEMLIDPIKGEMSKVTMTDGRTMEFEYAKMHKRASNDDEISRCKDPNGKIWIRTSEDNYKTEDGKESFAGQIFGGGPNGDAGMASMTFYGEGGKRRIYHPDGTVIDTSKHNLIDAIQYPDGTRRQFKHDRGSFWTVPLLHEMTDTDGSVWTQQRNEHYWSVLDKGATQARVFHGDLRIWDNYSMTPSGYGLFTRLDLDTGKKERYPTTYESE